MTAVCSLSRALPLGMRRTMAQTPGSEEPACAVAVAVRSCGSGRSGHLFLTLFAVFAVFSLSRALLQAPLKAAAIDVRCHSCTAPDVDAPATGGLLVPRTNTLLPPRFIDPTNQFVGRWHGNACGDFALLRSLSPSFAASQSNAPDHYRRRHQASWRRRREELWSYGAVY